MITSTVLSIRAREISDSRASAVNFATGARQASAEKMYSFPNLSDTNNAQSAARFPSTRQSSFHPMADREKETTPKKENPEKLRDLPSKKDVKGGSSSEKQNGDRRTGEIDFMQQFE
jgi:hypothetical protein